MSMADYFRDKYQHSLEAAHQPQLAEECCSMFHHKLYDVRTEY